MSGWSRRGPSPSTAIQRPVLDVIARLVARAGRAGAASASAPARLDAAGLFAGSDWDAPEALLPQLVGNTLAERRPACRRAGGGEPAAAAGDRHRAEARTPNLHADHARHFLTQVLALNLQALLRRDSDEADARRRQRGEPTGRRVPLHRRSCRLARRAGRAGAGDLADPRTAPGPGRAGQGDDHPDRRRADAGRAAKPGAERLGAERLVSALFGPTNGTHGRSRHRRLSATGSRAWTRRRSGARRSGFARAMHDTGLVSDYHAAFLRWAADARTRLAACRRRSGLGTTGLDCWRRYRGLIEELIDGAVTAETPQSVYGLALLLERGVLHHPPIAPGAQPAPVASTLQRRRCADRLALAFGAGAAAGDAPAGRRARGARPAAGRGAGREPDLPVGARHRACGR